MFDSNIPLFDSLAPPEQLPVFAMLWFNTFNTLPCSLCTKVLPTFWYVYASHRKALLPFGGSDDTSQVNFQVPSLQGSVDLQYKCNICNICYCNALPRYTKHKCFKTDNLFANHLLQLNPKPKVNSKSARSVQ